MHFYINLKFRKLVNTYFQKWPLQFMTKIYYCLSRNVKLIYKCVRLQCLSPVFEFYFFSGYDGPRTKVFRTQFSLLGSQNFSTLEEKCRTSARSCNVIYFFYILQSSKKLLEIARNIVLPLANKVKKTLIYRAWRRHPLPIMGVSAGGSVEENITSGTFLCLLIKIRVQ